MIEWVQKSKPPKNPFGFQQKPKKTLHPKLTTKKNPTSNFRALKNFQKAKQVRLYLQYSQNCRGLDTRALLQIFRLFLLPPKNPHLNKSHQKKYQPNFRTQRNLRCTLRAEVSLVHGFQSQQSPSSGLSVAQLACFIRPVKKTNYATDTPRERLRKR